MPQTGLLQSPSLDESLKMMPKAAQSKVSESQTSAGRLDKMLGQNSPLMQRAHTQGLQTAQSRGLLNSSMAAGAAKGAMIDRAQPFALQDSNNMFQNSQFNAGQKNQFGLLQANLIGDSYKSNQDYVQQRGLNTQAYGYERGLNEQQHGFGLEMGEQKYGFDRGLNEQQHGFDRGLNEQRHGFGQDDMRLEDTLKQGQMHTEDSLLRGRNEQQAEIEGRRDERLFGQQSVRDETLHGFDQEKLKLQADLTEAQANNDLDRQVEILDRKAEIDRQAYERQTADQEKRDARLSGFDREMQKLQSDLAEARAGNDFGRQKELTDRQAKIQEQRDGLLFEFENKNMDRAAEIQSARDARLSEMDVEMAHLQRDLAEAAAQNDFGRQKELVDKQDELQTKRDKLQFTQQEEKARNDLNRELERMGIAFSLDQKNLANAFSAMNVQNTLNNVQQILGDPGLNPEAKKGAIDNALAMANETMAWGATFYNTQVPGMATPGLEEGDRPVFGNEGPKMTEPETRSTIDRVYRDELGRAPDPGALSWWAEQAKANNWSEDKLLSSMRAGVRAELGPT